ncbi:alpha/beta hydrolase [Paenibacillus dauci]|uniref:alpha/beta hydrolase n=1 Tax=Paenibacillus dauci TaxID=1567106 RepID=UPI000619F46F|nr:alpha/beta hydrolase [Paenibacillus dauci]
MTTDKKVHLEPAAQKFADDNSKPPFLFDLGPEKGRETVNEVQSGDIAKPEVDIEDLKIPGGPSGEVAIRIVRPPGAPAELPVLLYIHGAGWVFGNSHTHDRLIRELAVGAEVAVVFPEYSLSPEAKYPTAIEEIYAVLQWIAEQGSAQGFDTSKLYVGGDSVGGNMTAAITLIAKERSGPAIQKQLLFYPVTDASFDTESYHQFDEGYFLAREGMQWFWDQYTTDPAERAQITASPLRATTEQLQGLPEALIITGEADVLRDEGEAYANKLREAGVPVTAARFQGIIHDFVMLNVLAETQAKKGAMKLANAFLREGL